MLAACLHVSATGFSQITLSEKESSVTKVINSIHRQSGMGVLYNAELLQEAGKVSVNVKNVSVEDALDACLKDKSLVYTIDQNTIIIKPRVKPLTTRSIVKVAPDPIVIKGRVTSDKGETLPGVSVYIKGTTRGIATDLNGEFQLEILATDKVLVFSCIGFKQTEIDIDGKTTFKVVMQTKLEDLNELVVVGYGTMRVQDLTGSVIKISESDFQAKNVTSSTSLLQGLASGVQVSGATGRPGETVKVRVRGATSLSGNNEPLYVINGVPSENSDIMNSITPTDIASIEVLKDASATAIYGSRAANGVIMVTTKSGGFNQKGKFNVNYHTSHDEQIKNFRMLDGDQFRSFLTDLAQKTLVVDPANTTAANILNEEEGFLGDANTDWFKLVKQNSVRQNFDISVSGGSDKIAYFMSGSMLDQKGMVIGDDLSRYNAHLNLDALITNGFKVGSKISLTYSDQNNSGTSLFKAQGYRPDMPVYKEDGVTYYDTNPVAYSREIDNGESYRLSGSLYGQVDIIDGLTFKTSISANQGMGFRYSFSPSFLSYSLIASASRSESRNFNTVFDNTLNYVKTINKHSINALAGISFENSESQYGSLSKKGFPMDEIYTNVSGGTDFVNSDDSKLSNGLFSSFARLNYKYNNKYLITLTTRYDGSSMFGKNHRFGFFPSAGLAWRINEENFMKGITFINELKLKASAGRTGIQNLSSYSNRDLYGATIYNGVAGIIHSQIGNNDIQWETSTLYDAGIDFSILENRVSGSLVYYVKNTENLIWSLSFPSSMAVNSMNYNMGSVTNQGIEFNVDAIIAKTNDFKFEVGLNLAHNRNEVTRLTEKGAVENSSGTIVQGSFGQVLAVGYPMGSFFGYEYNGILQNQARIDELNAMAVSKGHSSYYGKIYPGNLELTDLNGDGKVDTKDQTIIGNPDPDIFGGLNSTVSYKGFSLITNFTFQVGGVKSYGKSLQNVPSQLAGLVDYNLYNRWSPENPGATVPALYLEQGVMASTRMELHDASFFRLQDVRLSYDFPKFKQVPFQGQVYLSATNLFTVTKYPGTDPSTVNNYGNYGGNYETGYPGIRTYSVGLRVSL